MEKQEFEEESRQELRSQVKYFCLPNEVAALMIQGKVKATNIPEDARYLRCQYDFFRDCLVFAIQHESFDPVPEGSHFPMIDLELEVID